MKKIILALVFFMCISKVYAKDYCYVPFEDIKVIECEIDGKIIEISY